MIRRTALALAFVLAFSVFALAESNTSSPEARFQRLSQELRLSDQQKLKVLLRMQAEDRAVHAIRNDTSLSDAEKDARIATAHQKAEREIREVLTPAQQARFAAMNTKITAQSHPPER